MPELNVLGYAPVTGFNPTDAVGAEDGTPELYGGAQEMRT